MGNVRAYATLFGPGEGAYVMRHHVEQDLRQLLDSTILVPFMPSSDGLISQLEADYHKSGPLEGLVLAVHGRRDQLYFSDPPSLFPFNDVISMRNARTKLKDCKHYFADNARVLLYACNTGAESFLGNIARTLHDILEISVEAPKTYLVSPDSKTGDWDSQFALDDEGIIRFNYGNFAYYDSLTAKWADMSGKRCCIASRNYASRGGNQLSDEKYSTPDNMFLRL